MPGKIGKLGEMLTTQNIQRQASDPRISIKSVGIAEVEKELRRSEFAEFTGEMR
jgi:hypothetical protein